MYLCLVTVFWPKENVGENVFNFGGIGYTALIYRALFTDRKSEEL